MPDKNISAIAYNFLNLPKQIDQNANVTNYYYRADGVKVKKRFVLTNSSGTKTINTEYLDGFQYSTPNTEPIRKALENPDDATMEASLAGEEEAFTKDDTRKVAVVDPGTPEVDNMILSFFPTSEGYYDYENYRYIYQYKDHLGNVRVSYVQNGNDLQIMDRNDYYPFGMSFLKPFGQVSVYDPMAIPYNYKWSNKELQEFGGYDFGARIYSPDAPHWWQIDPLAEKYPNWNPYNYAFNDPVNVVDPDGEDGIRIIDKENKTITIRAVYYVQTQKSTFTNIKNEKVTVNGYSSKEVSKMNKNINGYLNDLKMSVSEGDYAGYSIKYDLEFKDGGTLENAEKLADSEKQDGISVGNSMRNGDSATDPVYFKTSENEDGTYSVNGGVTEDKKNIIMNKGEGDSQINKVHEIFHTLGMSHPKTTGGNKGIMKYPPEKPNQNDANSVGNGAFMPAVEKKKP